MMFSAEEIEFVETMELASNESERNQKQDDSLTADELQELKELEQLEAEVRDNSFNYIPILEEEIALEGLDGITLQGNVNADLRESEPPTRIICMRLFSQEGQTLWIRLEQRPGFRITLTDHSKATIFWNSIRFHIESLEFYELPVARPDLIHPLHFKDDKGASYEPLSAPDDIYIYEPIDDCGIHGSCQHYFQRQNVRHIVRQMEYDEVNLTFGNRMVIVQSQQKRNGVLFPSSIIPEDLNLTVSQYCILERVGRARYLGEPTRGKVSLNVMKIDPKTLFYQRKELLRKNLITKQPFHVKFGLNPTPAPVSILHLQRFYTKYETTNEKNLRKFVIELKNSQDFRIEAAHIRDKYGKHFIQILTRDYSDLIDYKDARLAELHPERVNQPDANKWGDFEFRMIKVFVLKNTSVNVEAYLASKRTGSVDDDSKEDGDENSEKNILIFNDIRCQTTILFKAWKHLMEKGVDGLTQGEFGDILNLFSLDARSITRVITKIKLATCVLQDIRKTKVQRYVYFKCSEANKIVNHISTGTRTNLANNGYPYSRLSIRDLEAMEGSYSSQFIAIPPPKSAENLNRSFETTLNGFEFEQEQAEVLPTENILGLTSAVTSNVDSTGKSLKGKMAQKSLKSTASELNTFIPVRSDFGENKWASPFTFENATGWLVTVEPAEVNPDVMSSSVFQASLKNLERSSVINELIKNAKLLVGFQRILSGVRKHELAVSLRSKPPEVDKRSLFRILKELYEQKKILIWRLTLRHYMYNPKKVYIGFTLFNVGTDSAVITEGVEKLIEEICPNKPSRKDRRVKLNIHRLSESYIPVKRPARPGRRKKQRDIPVIPLSEPVATANIKVITGTSINRLLKRRRICRKLIKYPSISQNASKNRLVYDEVDIRALRASKRQRALWTPKEDAYIFYLFIASILLVQRYNSKKLVIHNSRQIRDIMHLKLEEAKTKTTLSIRKRFHHLVKKEESAKKFRKHLSIANRDKELNFYIKDKYPVNTEKLNEAYDSLQTDAVIEVFEYLFDNFEYGNVRDENPIRQYIKLKKRRGETVEIKQLSSHDRAVKRRKISENNDSDDEQVCELLDDKDPLRFDEDVHVDYQRLSIIGTKRSRLASIISCSMAPKTIPDIWLAMAKSMLVSLLFSSNTHDVVQKFVKRVENSMLVEVINFLKAKSVATVPKGQRFTLSVAMKRRLQNHITPAMYNTCNRVWELAESNGTFNSSRIATLSALYLLSDLSSYSLLSDVKTNIEICLPANAVDYTPEWKEILIKSSTSNDEESVLSSQSNQSSQVSAIHNRSEQDRFLKLSRSPKLPFGSSSSAQPENQSIGESDDELSGASTNYAFKLRQYKSQIASQLGSESHIYKGVEANIFSLTLPNINFRFPMRFQGLFETNLRTVGDVPSYVERNVLEIVTPLMERKKTAVPQEFLPLLRVIWTAQETGISVTTLQKCVDAGILHNALTYFLQHELVYVVGTDCRRLVGFTFAQEWTVPLPAYIGAAVTRRVIMRSWITCAGAINWPMIVQLLTSLIGYLELHPGASFNSIANSLVPILNLVEASILLKILLYFNIVQAFKMPEYEHPSLFSKQAVYSQDYSTDTLLQFEELHFELADFHILKYSTFQRLLKPKIDEASAIIFSKGTNKGADYKTISGPPRKKKRKLKSNDGSKETDITVVIS